MTCKCGCGSLNMDKQFLSKLDLARDLSGIPYVINSGYRCAAYNAQVGGKPNSAHLSGEAADIKADSSRKRFKITKGLIDAGFNRLGKSFDDGFIHVDSDASKDPEVEWGY